mmetsp:Transcript_17083/g.48539  ORF Transcript_17083/g.48539 Transcript_17083/m.48539 type:complete len:378 (+) Transcript_17083:980-2113(+)
MCRRPSSGELVHTHVQTGMCVCTLWARPASPHLCDACDVSITPSNRSTDRERHLHTYSYLPSISSACTHRHPSIHTSSTRSPPPTAHIPSSDLHTHPRHHHQTSIISLALLESLSHDDALVGALLRPELLQPPQLRRTLLISEPMAEGEQRDLTAPIVDHGLAGPCWPRVAEFGREGSVAVEDVSDAQAAFGARQPGGHEGVASVEMGVDVQRAAGQQHTHHFGARRHSRLDLIQQLEVTGVPGVQCQAGLSEVAIHLGIGQLPQHHHHRVDGLRGPVVRLHLAQVRTAAVVSGLKLDALPHRRGLRELLVADVVALPLQRPRPRHGGDPVGQRRVGALVRRLPWQHLAAGRQPRHHPHTPALGQWQRGVVVLQKDE